MLLFYCTSAEVLDNISGKGIEGPVLLHTSFEEAEAECEDVILVVHAMRVSYKLKKKGKRARVKQIPRAAILNINPYLQPSQIIAGGGYVIREGKKEPEVLMIYRKGVWDLPKGKLDEGESIEECALREVREEVGIDKLFMRGELGNTVHGYARKGKYKVKTTYWYQMETPERDFTPQATEDIEAVKWMPWSKAINQIGYEIFRRHMSDIQALVVG